MVKDLKSYRKSYGKKRLHEDSIGDNPMDLFAQWFHELEESGTEEEPNIVSLATIGTDGFPKNRIVLLKGFDATGLVFYTNYSSEKGKSIAHQPKVCLSFFWAGMERQVIIKGEAEKVPEADSDAYFETRPKDSQLGALVSDQSEVIPSREYMDEQLEILQKKYKGKKVPRPEYWGGYRVQPHSIEFWQGRPNRLHDRILFEKYDEGRWKRVRLAP